MTIHASLKNATSSLHHQLDHMPMMQQLVSSTLNAKQYAAALKVLGAWFQDVERHFSCYWPENLSIRLKAPLIEQDLAALNEPLPVSCEELIAIRRSEAFAAGVLYVCEGASLGGLIIGPRVCQALQRHDVTHYYSCYGQKTREHWVSVLRFIDQRCKTEHEITDAVAGAKWAFTSLIQRVEQASPALQNAEQLCRSA